ncbi:MAG: CRISPR-associated endonuclease Cas6 [Candidatus Nanoarchaeia archaeon]|nr:CRISPR-associated endonuclease Cas6 [Candidatus Nanoarchaeia archaeon]
MEILAFKGDFKINFILPDYIGLGKSVSRGYGNVRKVK